MEILIGKQVLITQEYFDDERRNSAGFTVIGHILLFCIDL